MAFGLGMLTAAGCTQLNASHCGNQAGDATCEQRNPDTPFCNRCEAFNDGCMPQPVAELGCGYGYGTTTGSTGEPTTGGSTTGGSTSSESTSTTEEVDSSGGDPSICGNGAIEPGEECDGEVLPDGASCEAQGYGEGIPVCAADCTAVIYSVCPDFAECGNGEVGTGEECDGGLGDRTCDDFANLTGPGLMCTEQCTFDISACMICRENGQSCDDDDTCCHPMAVCQGLLGLGRKCSCPLGEDCM